MSHKVYIVEDHPVLREMYADFLKAAPGLELCGTAGSAEEVLGKLGDLDCDIVVTDYRLPGLSGAELVRRLRAERPDLPAVVISGHEDEAFSREAMEAGAAAFVRKRDLVALLVPTIHAVFEGRREAA
ncbi:MAG TPA: response regulator transcription factor [Rubricoccaceae bacterium]|jgi:DNA-binding NarL/FixJ family response regulator